MRPGKEESNAGDQSDVCNGGDACHADDRGGNVQAVGTAPGLLPGGGRCCAGEVMMAGSFRERLLRQMREAVVSDTKRREGLFLLLNIALSVISLLMSVVNVCTGESVLLAATLLFGAACLINVLFLRLARRVTTAVYVLFAAETTAILVFFFITGIPNGFSALWICLIPSFALLVFGFRYGSAVSLLAFSGMAFLFWLPVGRPLLRYAYTEEFMLRFPLLYLSIYVISFLIETVRAETQKQLEEAKRQYRHLYRHDALTGLYNRYGIYEYLEKIHDAAGELPLAVTMLDIDRFKSINDRYGHEFGDRVLAAVAETIAREVGDGGKCCRWGGEEFLIVSRLTDTAAGMADRICRRIAGRTFFCADGGTLTVTVSAGVCCAPQMCDAGLHKIIDLADKALYRSKRDGGNRATGIRWDPTEGQATTGISPTALAAEDTVGSGTPTES